jgi:Holliday junction resolvase
MGGGYIYKKGANFERALVDLFWENGWAAVRVAGSGMAKHPVPDVVAVKGRDMIIVECKTTSKEKLYLKDAVEGLKKFAYLSGAKAYLAVKFDREKPRFYDICELIVAEDYTIRKSSEYMAFESLVGSQQRLTA